MAYLIAHADKELTNSDLGLEEKRAAFFHITGHYPRCLGCNTTHVNMIREVTGTEGQVSGVIWTCDENDCNRQISIDNED